MQTVNSIDLDAWPVPAGICAVDDWTLFRANGLLRRLLHISGDNDYADALGEWFGNGNLERMAEDGALPTAASANFFFRDHAGGIYLICYLPAQGMPGCRLVAAQPLPREYIDRAAHLSMRELDRILDSIHDGIWVIDANGITTRINRAMERIAGIRAAEVVGRHVSEPLHEGRFKTCVTLKALEEKRAVTLFDDYSNGKRCLNTSVPILDAAGNIWRVIAAIRDLTELDDLKERLSRLEVEAMAHRLRARGLENDAQAGLLGQSDQLQRILQEITKAAHTEAVTLILGETGTGKSLAARLIHDLGARAQRPFVSINCGAIAPTLMESELFGYERGAFTGASRSGKPGMLELASEGTLLLDEIGELSLSMQARLLHILDGQPLYRVGSTRPIKMNARILAATNRPLEKMVAAGEFREDLFYRLRVLCVEMPPLRDRREDILLLAWHFLRQQAASGVKRFSPEVEKLFLDYAWPGNVRELQSVVQSLATLCEGNIIQPDDLPSAMRANSRPKPRGCTLAAALADLEKEMIAAALAEHGSTYRAAAALGVSQSQIARKARKYGLSAREPGGPSAASGGGH